MSNIAFLTFLRYKNNWIFQSDLKHVEKKHPIVHKVSKTIQSRYDILMVLWLAKIFEFLKRKLLSNLFKDCILRKYIHMFLRHDICLSHVFLLNLPFLHILYKLYLNWIIYIIYASSLPFVIMYTYMILIHNCQNVSAKIWYIDKYAAHDHVWLFCSSIMHCWIWEKYWEFCTDKYFVWT